MLKEIEVRDVAEVVEDVILYVDQHCCTCGHEVPTPKELIELDEHGEVIRCINC